MAFDGITISNLTCDLRRNLIGGRVAKIAQPESDELLLTIKNQKNQYYLLLSASASLPLIYFSNTKKQNPLTAPNFCMLLRKHIGSGKIIDIIQPSLERVIRIKFEHLNELGDSCIKYLIIEVMGKHSNIIFCDEKDRIIDSIKHVSGHMSSLREVLPGREYFIPSSLEKLNPLSIEEDIFTATVCKKPMNIAKAIYTTLTGISPIIAEEICHRANLDGSTNCSALTDNERIHLYHTLSRMMAEVFDEEFSPNIIYKGEEPIEFASVPLTIYKDFTTQTFCSISEVLETYYATKNVITRIRQKSSELRRVVLTALDRNRKKYELQSKQMKDTLKKDKYRIYGELLNTYGYSIKPGTTSFQTINYYNNEEVTIPLDATLSPLDNAKKYFERYNKLKRTSTALETYLEDTKSEIEHLESISTALDIALLEEDLVQLKEELMEFGYIKRKYNANKKTKITSKPYHYLSSDGFDMYVGKNNFQNDELTFKFATGNDWWFHAKGMPGSHVIVKAKGEELPDRTFEEAGQLAAYYSKGRLAPKVEIDYTQKKNIKKPAGGKPGFVVYYTNYSLNIEPTISNLKEVK